MRWQEISRSQGGVISHPQLIAVGLSPQAVTRAVRRGDLVRLSRGVYLVGGAPLTTLAQLWAAQLATGGVLAYSTAGRLWGVYDPRGDGVHGVHVTVPHARRIAIPAGIQVHRQVIPPREVRHQSGLPVTSRRRTVLDLLASEPYGRAGQLADRGVQRGWIDPDDCIRRVRAQPHRPGNSQLRRLAATLGDGAAAESERLLHRLLRRAGIQGWVPNYPLWHEGELVGVIDVAILSRRLAIEVDGMAYHVDADRFQADRSRQNAVAALGWTVLRFTWADLTQRPGYVVTSIRSLAA